MATKSVLKNINIHARSDVRKLVNALEQVSEWHGKEPQMSRTVSELKNKEEIAKFVGALK